MTKPGSLLSSRLATGASIILGLLITATAVLGFWGLSMTGFPDGHVTEYEKATELLRTILLWINLALGLYFFRLAIPNLPTRTRVVRMAYVLSMLLFLLAFVEMAMPWYFVDHLGLNDGRGG